MLKKDELPECPVATVVELIGNKWKLLIIRNLLAGTSRFNELQRGIPGISQKVLTQNLRALESDGLVVRTVFPEVPPHVEYSLSDMGKTLESIFEHMIDWGNSYKEFIASQPE
jgi:DNA-binding HxlR family transcriptional regulator